MICSWDIGLIEAKKVLLLIMDGMLYQLMRLLLTKLFLYIELLAMCIEIKQKSVHSRVR